MAWAIVRSNARLGWQASMLLIPAAYLMYRSYRQYVGKLDEERKHAGEIADLHLRTIEALALAIDAKDHTTHDHLERVRSYAVEIGRQMGISDLELEALRAAALLHDIGKLAVPEHIINKPGRLTPEEFEKMKIHPWSEDRSWSGSTSPTRWSRSCGRTTNDGTAPVIPTGWRESKSPWEREFWLPWIAWTR